jgi:GNAT superfamily N-acetyltransferase
MLLESGTWFVAVLPDNRIVGCGGWTPDRPDSGEIEPTLGHVRHFATHPDWTGRGIGRAIHDRSRDQALAAGIVRFACYASLNAVPFYTALGFRPVRRVETRLANHIAFPAMLMELDL